MLALALGFCSGCAERNKQVRLTDSEIRALAQKGAPVVDVRTPREYGAKHVAGSTNVPIDELSQRIAQVAPDKQAPIMVHCQSGGRSAAATEELKQMGYRQVIDLGSLARAQQVIEGGAAQ